MLLVGTGLLKYLAVLPGWPVSYSLTSCELSAFCKVEGSVIGPELQPEVLDDMIFTTQKCDELSRIMALVLEALFCDWADLRDRTTRRHPDQKLTAKQSISKAYPCLDSS